MDWIFIAFLIVSLLHMIEEYFYPGGFMSVMKEFRPKYSRFVTARMAIIFNGLQLLLCIAAIAVGTTYLIFSMSIAGLLLINGLVHIGASVRFRRYVPGVITSATLYLPLSLYAYISFVKSGHLTTNGAVISGVLGLLYQAVPMFYLMIAGLAARAESN